MARPGTEPRARRVALFVDRDGVINRRIPNDYVRHWTQFEMLPGVAESLARVSEAGATVFVVTNQRGVARRLIAPDDLDEIHARLTATLQAAGVALAGIYVCPHGIDECECRKPATGLFRQARADHPWVDFSVSHMVGDSMSDVEAGQRLGMHVWLVGEERRSVTSAANRLGIHIDGQSPSLAELVAGGQLLDAIAGAVATGS